VLQLVEGAVTLEQGVLHGVLGLVSDEASGDRVQTWELGLGEDAEALLRDLLAVEGSGISIL
jgi:hypothetical protein